MITIYGASGHAKVVHDIIVDLGRTIYAVVDDNKSLTDFIGNPISTSKTLSSEHKVVIAIGDNAIRQKLSLGMLANVCDPLVHSSVTLSPTAGLGMGTVVMPRAVINANVIIGKHCIVNTGAIIEHDCMVEDFAHISPGSILTGSVTIGEGAQVGAGAIVLPGVTIGAWSVVGAGAVVTKDVPIQSTVVGNPAKIVKKKYE